MNLRAACKNDKCPAFGIEKSVTVGTLLGYGEKGRVKCPSCGGIYEDYKDGQPIRGPFQRSPCYRPQHGAKERCEARFTTHQPTRLWASVTR